MSKGKNFLFGTHAPRESLDMISEKKFRTGKVASVTSSRKLWALNANSSKMAKGTTSLKFGRPAPRNSTDVTFEKFSNGGRGWGQVTP